MSKALHILYMPSWFIDGQGDLNGSFNYTWAKCMGLQNRISTMAVFYKQVQHVHWQHEKLNKNVEIWRLIIPEHYNKAKKLYIKWSKLLSKAKEISQTQQVDIVHNSVVWNMGIWAWLVSKKLNKPFFITEHSSDFVDKYAAAYKRKIAYALMKKADGVFVVSEILKKLCQEHGVNRVLQMPNFINYEIDQIQETKYNSYTYVHVTSKDIRRKGTVAMLDVYKKVRSKLPVQLLIVADKLTMEQVGLTPQQCKEYGIIWQNSVKDEIEYYKIISKAHCYVNFSVTETFAIVVVEAVRLGMHVIYTRSGGPEQYMTADKGCEIAVNDVEALENEMINAAQFMRVQSKSKAELRGFFGAEEIIRKHLEFYHG